MSAVPLESVDPPIEPLPLDTPRRRSSRSRTKSPEPIILKIQDPALSAVPEEDLDDAEEEDEEEKSVQQTPTDTQMYEKIIDEMDVDEGTAPDVNEDELLAEEPDEAMKVDSESNVVEEEKKLPEIEIPSEEKPATEEENRGTKRRSDSPSKGNTPKKRQRLPPPNIEDFVNDEDEPELDETSLQLSWCKLH